MSTVLNQFEDSYPEDEDPEYDTWRCVKCNAEFIDPELYPHGWKHTAPDIKLEPKMYWLGANEPLCQSCATAAGIPPVDEG